MSINEFYFNSNDLKNKFAFMCIAISLISVLNAIYLYKYGDR